MEEFLDDWGLTLVTFLPLVGAAVVMLIPKAEEQAIKIAALLTSVAVLAFGVLLLVNFDMDAAGPYQ